jgi:hypothetical protein
LQGIEGGGLLPAGPAKTHLFLVNPTNVRMHHHNLVNEETQ